MKLILVIAATVLAAQPRGTWGAQEEQQSIAYRGHGLGKDEVNFGSTGANNDDTRLSIMPPNEENAAAYSRWDSLLQKPRSAKSCGFSIILKTYSQELTDTYKDKFSVVTRATSLVASIKNSAKRSIKDLHRKLEKSFANYLATNTEGHSFEEEIRNIERVFDDVSTAINLIQADTANELTAIFSSARARAVEITTQDNAIISAEPNKPGIMAYTLRTRVNLIESMHEGALENAESKISEFRSNAINWYYTKLDKQYLSTLKREHNENESREKFTIITSSGF